MNKWKRQLRRTAGLGMALLGLTAAPVQSAPPAENNLVRVGLYQNIPKVGWDENGTPCGIFIDILEEIARREHWTLEYVPGTWGEGLDRVETGGIDLMPDVALSGEREALYAFHAEPVLSDWFEVFARRGSGIRSIVDLDGMRISVLERSVQEAAFRRLVKDFGLRMDLHPFPDYDGAFEAVATGQVDAVIANRFYGTVHLRNGLVQDTAIIFHPTRLFFAAPRTGDPSLLQAIDAHLIDMKQTPGSAYFQALRRWSSEEVHPRLPFWLKIAATAAAGLLLASFAWSAALKSRVARRTRSLRDRNREIERLLADLRTREERFRSFIENASDLVYTLDENGSVTFISPNVASILGHPPERFIGHPIADSIHPDDLPACLAALDRDRQGLASDSDSVEYRLRHADGSWRWHSAKGSFVFDPAAPPGYHVGISRDITASRRTKERLRLHAQLLDSVQESVVASDLDGMITYWGRGAEHLYGYTAAETLGRPYRDFAGAVDPPDETAFRRQILEAGSWRGEHRQKNRRGDVFWTSSSVSLVLDEHGQPAGFIGIDQDITERKQAEQALRDSQNRFASLFDHNPTGMVLIDRTDRTLTQVNPAAAALIGLPPDQITGRRCHDFMCPAEAGSCPVCDLHQAIDRSERVLVQADGTRIPILKTVVPVRLDGRDYLLESFIDISAQKQAEEQHQTLQAQLLHAQKMESIGRLAGGVAHDFNNILTVILGQAEILLSGDEPPPPVREGLLEIRRAAEHSADLTRQLLTFARKQPGTPRNIDINDEISGLIDMLRRLVGEQIEIRWRPADAPLPVCMDPSQVSQILANLCVNARDAIEGDGTLSIQTASVTLEPRDCAARDEINPGDYVRLEVCDTGCGMNDATLAHLFEPFFTTKEIGVGTGLGLSTVYGIVKQSGGGIEVDSSPGEGTCFRIHLPRRTGDVSGPEPPAFDNGGLSAGSGETILLVEDEPAILSICEAMLGKLGYNVMAAADPLQALEIARSHPGGIDLLLTDFAMPRMNGLELADAVERIRPGIRRLFMSGHASTSDGRIRLPDALRPFLPKPFALSQLAARIRTALEA